MKHETHGSIDGGDELFISAGSHQSERTMWFFATVIEKYEADRHVAENRWLISVESFAGSEFRLEWTHGRGFGRLYGESIEGPSVGIDCVKDRNDVHRRIAMHS